VTCADATPPSASVLALRVIVHVRRKEMRNLYFTSLQFP
jgi:hypothetical protein